MQPKLLYNILQYLQKKTYNKQGFTLVELLVVIIIIGILTAIALPTFLKQASKAKQAEAKNTIGAVNSGQAAYRVVHPSFANNFSELALGLPDNTANYTYLVDGSDDFGKITAQAKDTGIKGYSGAIERYADSNGQSTVSSTICEATLPGTSLPNVPSPSEPPDCTTVGMIALGR